MSILPIDIWPFFPLISCRFNIVFHFTLSKKILFNGWYCDLKKISNSDENLLRKLLHFLKFFVFLFVIKDVCSWTTACTLFLGLLFHAELLVLMPIKYHICLTSVKTVYAASDLLICIMSLLFLRRLFGEIFNLTGKIQPSFWLYIYYQISCYWIIIFCWFSWTLFFIFIHNYLCVCRLVYVESLSLCKNTNIFERNSEYFKDHYRYKHLVCTERKLKRC